MVPLQADPKKPSIPGPVPPNPRRKMTKENGEDMLSASTERDSQTTQIADRLLVEVESVNGMTDEMHVFQDVECRAL
jgi:hypothetical protein